MNREDPMAELRTVAAPDLRDAVSARIHHGTQPPHPDRSGTARFATVVFALTLAMVTLVWAAGSFSHPGSQSSSSGGDGRLLLDSAVTVVASDGSSIWALSEDAATAFHIDAASGNVTASIQVGDDPYAVAFGAGSVWVVNRGSNTVSRIDPGSNRVVATVKVGDLPNAIAASDSGVWVTNHNSGTVTHIDPATNQVVGEEFDVGVGGLIGIAAVNNDLWVLSADTASMYHLDATSGAVLGEAVALNGRPTIATDGVYVWATKSLESLVTAYDPTTGSEVGSVELPATPTATFFPLVAADGSMWVLDGHAAVDVSGLRVGTMASVDGISIAVAGAGVWVADGSKSLRSVATAIPTETAATDAPSTEASTPEESTSAG
jgi:YVTN family beta-propeller protein